LGEDEIGDALQQRPFSQSLSGAVWEQRRNPA